MVKIGRSGYALILPETTTPTAYPDHGKLYAKNTNLLFFQDGAGNEHEMAFVGAPVAHTHDGDTLQLDGVNSNGGAFSFTTTGAVTFNQAFSSANYTAANLLTAAASNAGEIDFTASGNKKLDVEDNSVINQDLTTDAVAVAFGSLILGGAGATPTEFSIDGTMAGNSDTAIPTEQAVKTYVDGHAPAAHVHDGDTLQIDGVNSDGGAFSFTTMGTVSFNAAISALGMTNTAGLIVHRTSVGAANYDPSALTTDYIIAMTDTAAPRNCIISTEDRDTGSVDNPRIIFIKDESGNAGTNAITVSLEGAGNIDNAANIAIDQDGGSIKIYIDGTNAWTDIANTVAGAAALEWLVDDLNNSPAVAPVVGAASTGCIVAGENCEISNLAHLYANILGGKDNEIKTGINSYSCITGGESNEISGNTATHCFIGGGQNSHITGASDHSVICGGRSNTISSTGDEQFIGCGSTNAITGTASLGVICGGSQNTVSSTNGAICGGKGNIVSTSYSFIGAGETNEVKTQSGGVVCGGQLNDCTGQYAFVGGGDTNTASGAHSVCCGGDLNRATAIGAGVLSGVYSNAYLYCQQAHAAGQRAATGDAQYSRIIARDTAAGGAAWTELFLDGAAVQAIIPADHGWTGIICVNAIDTTNDTCAGFRFDVCIKRDGAGNTILVGANKAWETLDGTTTDFRITADDANEAMKLEFFGEAGNSFFVTATVHLTESA